MKIKGFNIIELAKIKRLVVHLDRWNFRLEFDGEGLDESIEFRTKEAFVDCISLLKRNKILVLG